MCNSFAKSIKFDEKPLVSFVVIAYNQEKFIREAVEGAFAQTYFPLEIVLSDDCSNDHTFEIMQDMVESYSGAHNVILNQNDNNLGLADHVNAVMEIAKGEIIVVAGGDDISIPERCMLSVEFLTRNRDHLCVSFDTIKFSESEEISPVTLVDNPKVISYSLLDYIKDSSIHTNGASRAFWRQAVNMFPPLQRSSPTEDSPILLRCLMLGLAAQVSQPAVYYRVHTDNIYASDNKFRINYDAIHKQYLADIDYALESGVLDGKQKKSLIRSLEKKLVRNKIRSKFFSSKNICFVFVLHILPSRSIRLKQKYRYMMRVFRSFRIGQE